MNAMKKGRKKGAGNRCEHPWKIREEPANAFPARKGMNRKGRQLMQNETCFACCNVWRPSGFAFMARLVANPAFRGARNFWKQKTMADCQTSGREQQIPPWKDFHSFRHRPPNSSEAFAYIVEYPFPSAKVACIDSVRSCNSACTVR